MYRAILSCGAILAVTSFSALLNGAILAEMVCAYGRCGQLSQRCANSGLDPVPCTYCSGSAKGNFCTWAPRETCNETGTTAECGVTVTGLCRLNTCACGTADPTRPCHVLRCTRESQPGPPPQPR